MGGSRQVALGTELAPSTWIAVHVAGAVFVLLEPSLRDDLLRVAGVKFFQSVVKLWVAD